MSCILAAHKSICPGGIIIVELSFAQYRSIIAIMLHYLVVYCIALLGKT